MGTKDSDFAKGRAKGHKDGTWNKQHPVATGAGLGYGKPSGKSSERNAGYKAGRDQAKKGK